MPELPEIEHLAASLRATVVGRSIVGVRCRQPKMLNLPPEEFAARARGRIVAVARRGKSCLLRLEFGSIWLHLGLGGVVALAPEGGANPQLALVFADGQALTVDKTFMGHAHYYDAATDAQRWAELGVEPLAEEFTPARLGAILARKPKQTLKALLMDQSLIAGIGNVYSDEILLSARLHPARPAGSLPAAEVARLHAAVRAVLTEACAAGGAPEYADVLGRHGGYKMRIHGAKICGNCGGPVAQISSGGRTAYYCPHCQQ